MMLPVRSPVSLYAFKGLPQCEEDTQEGWDRHPSLSFYHHWNPKSAFESRHAQGIDVLPFVPHVSHFEEPLKGVGEPARPGGPVAGLAFSNTLKQNNAQDNVGAHLRRPVPPPGHDGPAAFQSPSNMDRANARPVTITKSNFVLRNSFRKTYRKKRSREGPLRGGDRELLGCSAGVGLGVWM